MDLILWKYKYQKITVYFIQEEGRWWYCLISFIPPPPPVAWHILCIRVPWFLAEDFQDLQEAPEKMWRWGSSASAISSYFHKLLFPCSPATNIYSWYAQLCPPKTSPDALVYQSARGCHNMAQSIQDWIGVVLWSFLVSSWKAGFPDFCSGYVTAVTGTDGSCKTFFQIIPLPWSLE